MSFGQLEQTFDIFQLNLSFFYLALAINQPNFCTSTTWYLDGITFANASRVGVSPLGMFVDNNNTVYVANRMQNVIQIWFEGNANPNITLGGGLNIPYSLFVTYSGEIYVDNGYSRNRTDKWPTKTNTSISVMTTTNECYGIFIDVGSNLYCSMAVAHQVVKRWLFSNGTTAVLVAGTGVNGSSTNMLNNPAGLFVDLNFNLYVADSSNGRIQMFPVGQMNATTVVGNGALGTIALSCPYGITFDANGYIFISDRCSDRIIGSGRYGFRCIIGCTGVSSSGPAMLNSPRHIAFDSYGNLFVADSGNDRIQKFILASNSCSTYSRVRISFCRAVSTF